MSLEIHTLDLCESCIATHEGMGVNWHVDALPAAHIINMHISRATHDEDGNARPAMYDDDYECGGHFGTHCDGCDTQLGGERYCYVGVAR